MTLDDNKKHLDGMELLPMYINNKKNADREHSDMIELFYMHQNTHSSKTDRPSDQPTDITPYIGHVLSPKN